MAHKCDGCKNKGEHYEMGFRPFGVCTKERNLIEAEMAYNAEKCPYQKTIADIIREMPDDELAGFFAQILTNFAVRLLKRLECPTEETAASYEETKIEFLEFIKQPAEE